MTGRLLVCGSLQFLDLFLLWAAALGSGEPEELDSHLRPTFPATSWRAWRKTHLRYPETHCGRYSFACGRQGNQDAEDQNLYWFSMNTLWNPGRPLWGWLTSDLAFFPSSLPSHHSSLHPREKCFALSEARPSVALDYSVRLKCFADAERKRDECALVRSHPAPAHGLFVQPEKPGPSLVTIFCLCMLLLWKMFLDLAHCPLPAGCFSAGFLPKAVVFALQATEQWLLFPDEAPFA